MSDEVLSKENRTFNPLRTSKNICDTFRRYILSTFKTNSEIYNDQLTEIMKKDESIVRGPFLQISHNFPTTCCLEDLIKEGVTSKEFIKMDYEPFLKRKLYIHQEESIRKVDSGRNIVVSTGTGSGKTECFIIPILNDLLKENEAGTLGPGVRVMLLYPLNALANDQLERMRDILSNYPEITFGTYTGETEETKEKADDADMDAGCSGLDDEDIPRPVNEIYDRETFRRTPPNILITNYAMLEHLLIKPENNSIFGESGSNHWKFIVMDEVHTYNGAKGSEVSMLLKRLKTTLGKEDMRFILTSATLGSDEDNIKVADFAHRLTGAVFTKDDIIRSQYISLERSNNEKHQPMSFYSDIADIINDSCVVDCALAEYLKNYGCEFDDARLCLYDLVYGDPIIHEMSALLDSEPMTITEVSKSLNILDEDVINIITVVSGTEKYGNRVFNAKYHLFIKGLDGAYITLKGSEKLFTIPQKEYSENGVTFKVYQISTCYNCHATYILGDIRNGHLIQVARQSADFKGYQAYMLLNDQELDQKYREKYKDDFYTLCSVCGRISQGTEACACGSQYQNKVVKVKDVEKVSECPACGNRDSSRGLLRQLYLGQDASTSVIASSLYADLVKSKDSRFLTFSDNRQSAAFFAPYLEDSYNSILLKRILYETMIRNKNELLNNDVSFDRFYSMVSHTSKEYGLKFDDRTLFNSIVRECAQNNSYRSLEYLGFLKFEIGYDSEGNELNFGNSRLKQFPELKSDEIAELINSLLKFVRDKRAVTYDTDLLEKYEFRRGFVLENLKKEVKKGKSDSTSKQSSTASLYNETNRNYLINTLGTDEEKIKDLLKIILSRFMTQENGVDGRFLNLKTLKVSIPDHIYQCTKCRGFYPFNFKDTCIRCGTKTLVRKEVSAIDYEGDKKSMHRSLDLSNHYIRNIVDSPLRKLTIKEHTAQLNSKRARCYQKKFKQKMIDGLSCSTTFEMGVDIGTLNSVFMRNVPPSPANYIQRAGRAGRGKDSSAFAVTFCKEASHDVSYFNDPKRMICGNIDVPLIKTDNRAIVIRHVYATAFSFFWKIKGEFPKTVKTFVEQYDDFKEYLISKPNDLREYLKKIVPIELQKCEDPIDIENYGWIEDLISDDENRPGRLEVAILEFKNDSNVLDEPFKKLNDGKITQDRIKKYMSSMITSTNTSITLNNTQTLKYLSKHNLVPKYGFPADTVPLEPISGNKNVDMSRDLTLAIGDYAPGSEVIVDGRKYESRYITTVPYRGEWIRYRYRRCDECGKISILIDNGLSDEEDPNFKSELQYCSCGAKLCSQKGKFIVPDLGFKCIDRKLNVSQKPVKAYSGTVSFCDKYDLDESIRYIGKEKIQLIQRTNSSLVKINDSHYAVCKKCGYSELSSIFYTHSNKKHIKPNGRECDNSYMENYDLGHVFRTDALIINILSKPCRDIKQAISVLYALLEGFSRAFGIERNEIDGCLDNVNGAYSFIIYDTTPGGSGYVSSINDDASFVKMIDAAKVLVNNCNCGGDNKDTACYSCLKTYSNQQYHDDLIRKLAIDYFEELDL